VLRSLSVPQPQFISSKFSVATNHDRLTRPMRLECLRVTPIPVDQVEGTDFSRLLSDFHSVLDKDDDVPLTDNEEYMQLIELQFLLRNIRELTDINLYQVSQWVVFSVGIAQLFIF
jgi:hypothetical protein